jgi:dTDP-4-dehydrorhamnose reductase
MKLLVLGASGQLGTDLLAGAAAFPGLRIATLARNQLDVAQPATVRGALEALDFEVLVNCTSYHKTDEVELNAAPAFAVNAHAVREMARACRSRGARFCHVSTDYVFSGEGRRPYREDDCTGAVNVYGASKAMGERLALLEGGEVTILRVASLFGVAGASGKGGNFVETMIRLAREKGEVRVVNDVTMSPTATADLAGWILRLVEARAPGGVYHAVNSGQATWFEFAVEILRQAAIEARTTPIDSGAFPTVARRPSYSVLDNSRLAGTLGPLPDWRDGLARYLAAKGHVASERAT